MLSSQENFYKYGNPHCAHENMVWPAFLISTALSKAARGEAVSDDLLDVLVLAEVSGIITALANAAGLAAIVGAFAAGLILEEVHFHGFREEITIEKLLKPIATFLVPIFFVLMGIQVRLETFANLSVLGVAAGLTIVAIIGKQICGLGVLEKELDRLTVGVGMIPRGEVGLIFTSIGKGLKVIDDATFSAVVIMVIVTTLITPPVLKVTLANSAKKKQRRST